MKEYYFDVEKQTDACVAWIRDWFKNNGNDSTRAVIGISGGKDSTVTAALLCKALGVERVVGVLMPCGTQVDIADSQKVVKALGIKAYTVNIGETYNALTNAIRDVASNGTPFPTEQYSTNTPARLRMATLYGIGATIGNCRVVNTCNFSEDAVGYATYGGDGFNDFAPINHFTTEEVIAIGDYLGIPYELTHKKPTDGMSLNDDGTLKGDEDKLGFTYEEINKVIRFGEKTKHYDDIVAKFKACRFKLDNIQLPFYNPDLPNYFLENFGI